MMRSDPQAQVLDSQGHPDAKTRIQEYFTSVKPTLVQIANTFADMHDTPTRMVKTGAIKAVVDWSRAREFFCYRLRYRMGLKQSAPCLGNSAPTQLASDEYLRLLHESKGDLSAGMFS
jgi:acetyl-CoA carboxylase/biotin carboxylase 1